MCTCVFILFNLPKLDPFSVGTFIDCTVVCPAETCFMQQRPIDGVSLSPTSGHMEHGEELAKNTQLGLAPSGNAVVYYKSGSRVQGEAVVFFCFFYPNNYMLKFS